MDGGSISFPRSARIGPNALLQLIRILDHFEGRALRDRIFAVAGVLPPPPDAGMWPEADCAAVHQTLRHELPDRAPGLLRLAGIATADYILAHRIPPLAQRLIRGLPGVIAAPILASAIARHAWTFAGSGRFAVERWFPLTFRLEGNPLIAGEHAESPLCDWHAAVFERLFRRLIWPGAVVEEVECAGTGAPACRFVLRPRGLVSRG
jgi:divinyl protochlorophyllide a 8-vinyl-reductase